MLTPLTRNVPGCKLPTEIPVNHNPPRAPLENPGAVPECEVPPPIFSTPVANKARSSESAGAALVTERETATDPPVMMEGTSTEETNEPSVARRWRSKRFPESFR